MPFEMMDTLQVARYLHLGEREVAKLASRGKLPCQKRKQGFVFRKIEIDHWVEVQLHELPHQRLAEIEAGVRRHHGMDEHPLVVCDMIPPVGVAVPLESRTTGSVLRDLIKLGETGGVVYDRDQVLRAVMEREELCSTAILPNVALPHPRHPVPYDIATSFVVVGRSESGIPFSAADGSLTRLFFLICCKDDRTHLHVLARLGQMLHHNGVIDNLLDAADADELRDVLTRAEQGAIATAEC